MLSEAMALMVASFEERDAEYVRLNNTVVRTDCALLEVCVEERREARGAAGGASRADITAPDSQVLISTSAALRLCRGVNRY